MRVIPGSDKFKKKGFVMEQKTAQPSKFWAYIAIFFGAFLLLAGLTASISYLNLPISAFDEDVLGSQLGQMAGMFLGLGGGVLAIIHGLGSIRNRQSRTFQLPRFFVFLLGFAIVLGLGNMVLNFEIVPEFLFPPLFLLGAALPTLVVLTWVGRRLAWPITWRQAALAFVAGSTLSILVAIVLEMTLPYLAVLLLPLDTMFYSIQDLFSTGESGFIERLFQSPLILTFLLATALQAPIPEEFAKALSLAFFGRARIRSEQQAFMIGMASGAGFAILENMLYEGLYAQWSGWTWGGITLLRGLGSVLHPLGTGLVALGWYRAREKGWGELRKAYLVAVVLHTLWNGGFMPFVFLTGADYSVGVEAYISIYGLAVEVLLIVFLVFLSIGLWWYLRTLVSRMSLAMAPEVAPQKLRTRALAVWSIACLLVIVPIGAAIGPAWRQIRAVLFPGF